MINIALRSEYSFQKCFYPLEQLVTDAKDAGCVGVADLDNTFAHPKLKEFCERHEVKPIYGVRLRATEQAEKSKSYRTTYQTIIEFLFIAKNDAGLSEIYKLVNTAYDNFYYFPRLTYQEVINVSRDVFVSCERTPIRTGDIDSLLLNSRIDFYARSDESCRNADVAVPLVLYPREEDIDAYETLCAFKGIDSKTYPTHLRSEEELLESGYPRASIDKTHEIAEQCNAQIKISEFVTFPDDKSLKIECIRGAHRLGVDLDYHLYRDRFEKELNIIEERGFTDYFLIVSDVLQWAKKTMLVGPGRGSSGGSLVCYLLGITEIDPIEHGLIFERFVDLNRVGLPDIDTDIPDINRQEVIKYLQKRYGTDNVKSIGTVTTFKPISAIADTAKALGIPAYEVEELKESVIERPDGDAKAKQCVKDTFDEVQVGKAVAAKFPQLRVAEKLEGHAKHAGKHAAGIIVSNRPLYEFAGVNSREFTFMISGKQVEDFGLLKIDVLGLRTLSVIQETAKSVGVDYQSLYSLPLNDPVVFDIFNNDRVYGIFQFEGSATRNLTRQIKIEAFEDICALTALSRPGALISGEAAGYVFRKNGDEAPLYYGEIFKRITEPTLGAVIFQEQGMELMRRYAGMDWSDVNTLRKAISKSYGAEFFSKYKKIFINGAVANGQDKEEAKKVWNTIASMGSYSFNKSHAVAYSIISYWTAWCKAYHPLEFAAANMNHIKDTDNAVRVLRDFVINDQIEYVPVDPEHSQVNWTIKDGKLLGGLTNLDGIGIKKAQTIIKTREAGGRYTPAIARKLQNPETPFDILFPAQHLFGKYYKNPNLLGLSSSINMISEIDEPGEYVVIGKVILKDVVFRNSSHLVAKRGSMVDKDFYYLKLIIEDDTSDIMCQIPPFKYEELNGEQTAERITEGETWVILRGIVQESYRSISITQIGILK